MNILVISQKIYPDTFGGTDKFVLDQSKYLAKLGHRVTVVVQKNVHGLPNYEEKEGLRIYRCGRPYLARIISWILMSRICIKKTVRKLAKENDFDLIVCHHPFVAYSFMKTRLSSKKPWIYTFHASLYRELEIESGSRQFSWKFLKKIYRRVLQNYTFKVEKQILGDATGITVLSNFSKSIIKETFPETDLRKVEVIPTGVEISKYTPPYNKELVREELNLPKKQFLILSIRRLTRRMGLENLIKAMPAVLKKYPETKLIIGGTGPLQKKLEKLIKKNKLEQDIKMTGMIPEEKISKYYQSADLFVLPTIAFEGFGLATLEALSSGIPVLATPAGASPEVLSKIDKDLVLKGISPEEIAEGIIRQMEKTKQKSYRDIVIEKFDWQNIISDYEQYFKKIAKVK